jgi:hypothetical protein
MSERIWCMLTLPPPIFIIILMKKSVTRVEHEVLKVRDCCWLLKNFQA